MSDTYNMIRDHCWDQKVAVVVYQGSFEISVSNFNSSIGVIK